MTQIAINQSDRRDETPEELTERLRKSMAEFRASMTKESAKEFLSGLSMYDEDGKLKKEF